ncbi:hypothetical protein HZI73_01375 [Vallitalea pronyensis]|uniref:Uncharacterized protein n=1 Tax=Vallitalea pronyensis TaxID=1348613 RepID=A0A8J8SEY1_9FIRM|nr:hypothetical protein [Vallitalea pronyensis]QUI21025.1 hypothetical protein HZI73_01375 [Vallitalea pronyensis]
MSMIKGHVNFQNIIREWDGFGVNYVETAQTPDYLEEPQDYGGFQTLSEEKRQEIIDLIFGEDGLKPSIIKMFCDGFHQNEPHTDPSDMHTLDRTRYDHLTTTQWTRYFAREGLKKAKAMNYELQIITTLYQPPAFMTKQKMVRGRDLDPKYMLELAKYMASWVKYLKEQEGLPVTYMSIHNEGEDHVRWPSDGKTVAFHGEDYNCYWPKETIVAFMPLLRRVLDHHQLQDVGITPGETSSWFRFDRWGYADAIAENHQAIQALGLITSHAFINYPWYNYDDRDYRWFGDARSAGIDTLREKKPSLHAWGTSCSWLGMDVPFLDTLIQNIYSTKVNALIPWACIQVPSRWRGGDPNPGTAIKLDGQGHYEVMPGYYFYKQITRAGQPKMAVAKVSSNDTELSLVAFSSHHTDNKNAFLVLNLSPMDKEIELTIEGCGHCFEGYRTSSNEQYAPIGDYKLSHQKKFTYHVPKGSATTFFEK